MNKSIQLVYFLAFLPFVNFGISLISSDTQPFYFLIIVLILLYKIKDLFISPIELFLFFLAIIISFLSASYGFDLKKSFNLLIFVIAILFFKRYSYTYNTIRLVLIIYFIFLLFWITLPSLAYGFQSLIVRNINTGLESSYRGIPVLSTEPGLFSGVGFLLIELFLLKIRGKIKKSDYFLIGSMLTATILSFSGTTIVFLFLFLILRAKVKLRAFLFLSAFLFLFGKNIFDLLPENRLTYFLGFFLDFDFVIFLNDSSLSYRISALLISIDFFIKNFFGAIQSDNLIQTLQNIYTQKYYNPRIGMDSQFHLVSSFGYSLICGGVFTIIYFITILKRFFTIKGFAYFLLCILFSYSLIFPLPLILLIELSKNKNKCAEY